MSSRASLVSVAIALSCALGCARVVRVDDALAARTRAERPSFDPPRGPLRAVRFAGYTVDALERPSTAGNVVGYGFTLHTPEGASLRASCTTTVSDGSWIAGTHTSVTMECTVSRDPRDKDRRAGHTLLVSASGGSVLVTGAVHGLDRYPPEDGEPRVEDSLVIHGSPTVWNLGRERHTWTDDGGSRRDTPEELPGPAVAAVALEPEPVVFFAPDLAPRLKVEAALAAAWLLIFRGQDFRAPQDFW